MLSSSAPGKLLPSPELVVTDPLPKYLRFGWWSSPVQLTVTKLSSKEAVTDRDWVK